MSQDIIRPDHDYLLQVSKFPCTFNLESVGNITLSRLRYIRHNVLSELQIGNDIQEEVIRKKNLLTMVEFRLGDRIRALELNEEVVQLTNWTNIPSLGNRCFIMVSVGDEPEAKKCLQCLKKIRTCHEKFDALLTEAVAEQAYCYSRLGGPDNLRLAINLFTLAVTKRPHNYLWKFGLGLVYRRATHTNIYCSSLHRFDVEEFKNMAAEFLFDVGEHASSSNLRAMAYAQLVKLRQDHSAQLFPHYDYLFRYNNIQQLCDKALEYGKDIPSVLTQCGRSLKTINLEKAVDLLERSVSMKRNTIAYHHLGLCYKKQAELLTQGRYMNHPGSSVGETDITFQIFGLGSSSSQTLREIPKTDSSVNWESMYGEPDFLHVSTLTPNPDPDQPLALKAGALNQRKLTQKMHISNTKLQTSNAKYTDCCKDASPTQYLSQEYFQSPRQFMRSVSCEYFTDESTREEAAQESYNIGNSRDSTKARGFYQHTQGRTRNSRGLGRVYNRSLSEGWSPREEVKAFVASSDMSITLNRNDMLVQKAISCYKYAIQLSNWENLPAILDLGIILKQTGQVREALTQFNSVTNSQLSLTGHRVTVISAYEQAGLCYLELSKIDGNQNNYEKDGQKKLTKAISLAADLALTISELKDCAQDVWIALRTLLNQLDRGPRSQNQQKQKIKLLELVRDHGQVIEVVQKMREISENELDDQDVVRSALTSYLELEQPENALAFQNMVGIGLGIRDSKWWKNNQMRSLRAKVLLQAISGRLRESNDNPTYLFQQLFELCYDKCVSFNAYMSDDKKHSTNNNTGDILVVFDDDQDTEEGPSLTMKSARYITILSTCLFGLEAKENLQGTGEYGDCLPIQLKEMQKYQVVLLILGNETRNRRFDAMLERVSYNNGDGHAETPKILVLDAGLRDGQVPLCLRQYECFKLEDIGGLGDVVLDHGGGDEGDQLSFIDIINNVFHGDVDAVLKLFCFITGQEWPCP